MRTPLNLASRPFRNERLPALLFAVASGGLVIFTIAHLIAVRSVLPRRTSGLRQQVASGEKELVQLREEAESLRRPRVDRATLAQWILVKDLVDQRTFGWRELFAVLEDVMPLGVRLTSISPKVKAGVMTLELHAEVRSTAAGLKFARQLENRSEFDDVYPTAINSSKESGQEFDYSMRYLPPPLPALPAAQAGTKSASDEVASTPAESDGTTSDPDLAGSDPEMGVPEVRGGEASASPSPGPKPNRKPRAPREVPR